MMCELFIIRMVNLEVNDLHLCLIVSPTQSMLKILVSLHVDRLLSICTAEILAHWLNGGRTGL